MKGRKKEQARERETGRGEGARRVSEKQHHTGRREGEWKRKGEHDKEVRMCKSEAAKGNEGREQWRRKRREKG